MNENGHHWKKGCKKSLEFSPYFKTLLAFVDMISQ